MTTIVTTVELDADVSTDGGATWERRSIPAWTVVTGITFELPDPSVGLHQGSASGSTTLDNRPVLVDFGGSWDNWFGPADRPDAGWFRRTP